MSRLEKLIAELCPHGVESVRLDKVAEFKYGFTDVAKDKGSARFIRITDINDDGKLKLSDSKYIDLSEDSKKYLLEKGDLLMARTGATYGKTMLFESDKPSVYASFLIRIRFTIDAVLPAYYWHFAQSDLYWNQANKLVSKAGQPQFNANALKMVIIPIPPLNVQKEVVRILDNFKNKTDNLVTALSEELTARKKQYEYYRDQLLTFDDDIPSLTIGEIASVTKLAGFEFTEHIKYSDEGSIIALRGLNVKKGYLDLSNVKYIDGSNFPKLSRSKLVINDMLFTYVGTIGEVALIDKNDKYYLAPNVARIRLVDANVNPMYMRYYFQTHHFLKNQINRYLASSSMKNLTMESIRKFQIPLPSLIDQERIVAMLDRFDTLTTDITSGLPAEIAARQKQYEYYRDKLLTFKEMA